jgi:hypothetical protein
MPLVTTASPSPSALRDAGFSTEEMSGSCSERLKNFGLVIWDWFKLFLIYSTSLVNTAATLVYILYSIMSFFSVIACKINFYNRYLIAAMSGTSLVLGPGLFHGFLGYVHSAKGYLFSGYTPASAQASSGWFGTIARTVPTVFGYVCSGANFFDQIASMLYPAPTQLTNTGGSDCISDYFLRNPYQYIGYIIGAALNCLCVVSHVHWLYNKDVQNGTKPMLFNKAYSAFGYAIAGFITAAFPLMQQLISDVKNESLGIWDITQASVLIFLGALLIPIKSSGYDAQYNKEIKQKLTQELAAASGNKRRLHTMLVNTIKKMGPLSSYKVVNVISVGWSAWMNIIALQQVGTVLNLTDEQVYTMAGGIVASQSYIKLLRLFSAFEPGEDEARAPLLGQ